jgi:hypothetical protein
MPQLSVGRFHVAELQRAAIEVAEFGRYGAMVRAHPPRNDLASWRTSGSDCRKWRWACNLHCILNAIRNMKTP